MRKENNIFVNDQENPVTENNSLRPVEENPEVPENDESNMDTAENTTDSMATPVPTETLDNNSSVKGKNKFVIIGIAVAVIALIAVIAIKVVIPSIRYASAEKAFSAGDFSIAMAGYEKLGDYKDAAEKAVLAEKAGHYQSAETLFTAERYEEACSEFKLAGDYKDAAEKAVLAEKAGHYQSAEALFDSGDFAAAFEEYKLAKDYEGTALKIESCASSLLTKGSYDSASKVYSYLGNDAYKNYCDGMIAYNSKDYTNAEKAFTKATNVENANEMKNASILMQAEEYWTDGHLNTAKKLYESLPEGFTYGGVDSTSRLSSLNAYADFVALCGQWKSKNMDASVRQTHDSTGLWDQWDGEGYNYTVDIKCVINNDDTVTLTADANFWIYTNFSSLSRYLKTADRSATFKFTGKKLPSSLSINTTSFTGNAITGSLTTAKNNLKLSYQIKDSNSSMNFTYTYKAFGTYDSLVKAY